MTIGSCVALECLGDALAITTLEFVVAARVARWRGGTSFFVCVVTAIVFAVATPGFEDAFAIAAFEFVGLAKATGSGAAAVFVGTVGAIVMTVANFGSVDALAIHASGLIVAASCWWAIVNWVVSLNLQINRNVTSWRRFRITNGLTNVFTGVIIPNIRDFETTIDIACAWW